MKLKEIDNQFYLLSDKKFNQNTEVGTEYYDGKGNIRVWGTGNCFSTDSVNIIASTEPMDTRPMINIEDVKKILQNNSLNEESLNKWFNEDMLSVFHTSAGDVMAGYRAGFIKKSTIDKDKIFTTIELEKAMRTMIRIGMEIGREPSYNDDRINETISNVIKTSFPEKTEWEVDVLVEDLVAELEWIVPSINGRHTLKLTKGFVKIFNKK